LYKERYKVTGFLSDNKIILIFDVFLKLNKQSNAFKHQFLRRLQRIDGYMNFY